MTVCCSLLFLLLVFIWGNSLLPGHISGALSDGLKNVLTRLFPFLFPEGGDSSGGGLLRKIAHFSEFSVLGTCLCYLFGMLRRKQFEPPLFAAASGILAACVDETIQRFVPLRHGCLTDVGIDTAGVIAGIVLFVSLYQVVKHNQHLEEMK